MQVHERLLRTVAGYREARDAVETHAWRASRSLLEARSGCTQIPVVVHVVYQTAAQNISDAQVDSQIAVLNDDYRRRNGDIGTVPAAFQPLIGDTRVQFALASVDPAGNPTNGIVRVATNTASFTDDDAVKSTATGGSDAWPRDRYLNIWVCQLGGGLLGYAQFPGGPAATDGVVILHTGFGTTGTAAAPFNLGRTTTHEVGHWLNLRHIWGDDGTGCLGSDFVPDTPNQAGPNYGAPAFPSVSCGNGPNGDMFMNYMDYVDDAAMVMFTAGQVTRMQAALDGPRSGIGTTVKCTQVELKPPLTEKLSHKEPLKDFHKEPLKEFHKETFKELHKDPLLEPIKHLFEPPKHVFEPPKQIVESPSFTPQGPGPAFGLGGQGMPFVLATPGTGFSQPQAPHRQQLAGLTAAYGQILAQLSRMHAAGALDAAGIESWRAIATTYQQLLQSGESGG